MMSAELRHVPVLRDRVIALLAPALSNPGSVLVDATVGLGGHAELALQTFPALTLIGLDRDESALTHSRERLAPFGERVNLVHAVYDEMPTVLKALGYSHVQGVLFDLGVSSMQLDEAERGFSYSMDNFLDMRMDQNRGATAADVVNTYSVDEITRVLRQYGEEKFARRIAQRIVSQREVQPFANSARLVDVIRDAIPAPARRTGGNPAKRSFQALRIEVNDELGALRRALPAALESLSIGGRIVVMSYQSLEDAMVKQVLRAATTVDLPYDLPFIPEHAAAHFSLLTRGAEKASAEEVEMNPRAASVRVRAAERVAA